MRTSQHTIHGINKDSLNPNGFGGMCSRSIKIEKDSDPVKGIPTIATTANPALVVDWDRWAVVREVLPMKYCELPEGKLPLLDSHSRWSVADIKGSAKDWGIEGSKLTCMTYVSESEPQIIMKISEKHIDSVSLGYETDKMQTVEIPKGKEVIIDGIGYKNEYDDDYAFLVRTWWKPKELSMVPIGADDEAKFRALSDKRLEGLVKKIADLEEKINVKSTEQPIKKTEHPTTEQKNTVSVSRSDYLNFLQTKKESEIRKAVVNAIKYKKGIVL